MEGVRLEQKGPVIAIHYRAAPDMKDKLAEGLSNLIAGYEGYMLQAGKMVFEAKPKDANKGTCLERVMEMAPFMNRSPIMIGDDRTDEDAFAAVRRLGGWSIKVGEGDSLAEYRLGSYMDVIAYLKEALGGE